MKRSLRCSCRAALHAGRCARPVAAGVTELIYATPYAPDASVQPRRPALDRLRRAALRADRCSIRPMLVGRAALVRHSIDELRHGVADIGLITPIYVRGGAHLIRIQSGFYSGARYDRARRSRSIAASTAGDAAVRARARRAWSCWPCRAAACPGSSPASGRSAGSRTCKGMRIRAPTELLAVLRELGADPVNMPMGEVYSAMAKGVIDGVIAPVDTFKSLHFAEVAHYYRDAVDPARRLSRARDGRCRAGGGSPMTSAAGTCARASRVWEAALARENRRSLAEGRRAGAQVRHRDRRDVAGGPGALRRALPARGRRQCRARCARYGIDGRQRVRRGARQHRPRTARSPAGEALNDPGPGRHPRRRFQPCDGGTVSRRTCCDCWAPR